MTTPFPILESLPNFLCPRSKPNTRIPPIIQARRHSNSPIDAEQCNRLASLSQQKLHQEASSGDPSLRRCLGHHRLLRRSLQEAHNDMKRYLDDVLESDTDDEEQDEEVAVCQDRRGDGDGDEHPEQHQDQAQDQEHEKPIVPARKQAQTRAPDPRPKTVSAGGLVRERIVGVVRAMARRRHTSHHPRGLSSPPTAPYAKSHSNHSQIFRKNSSCSEIPTWIHVHDHLGKAGLLELERSQSLTQTRAQGQSQTQSIALRGQKYAVRFKFRRKFSPVATTTAT